MDNEPIETVPNFSMAVPGASGYPLPYNFPSISTHLETIAVVLCVIVIAHEPQKSYVYWSRTELESFEMQAKVLTIATENLSFKILNQSRHNKEFKANISYGFDPTFLN